MISYLRDLSPCWSYWSFCERAGQTLQWICYWTQNWKRTTLIHLKIQAYLQSGWEFSGVYLMGLPAIKSLFKNRVGGLPLTFSSKISIKFVWKTDIVTCDERTLLSLISPLWLVMILINVLSSLIFSVQTSSCSERCYLGYSRKILFFLEDIIWYLVYLL